MAAVISSCGCVMARMPFQALAGAPPLAWPPMKNSRPSRPTRLSTPIARKIARQDQRLPRNVPSGTPTASASVSPIQTTDSARPERAGGTSWVAASEATAMNTPWPRPTTKRTASSRGRLGAAAINPLPTASTAMDSSRMFLSFQCATRAVMNGAPIDAPSA